MAYYRPPLVGTPRPTSTHQGYELRRQQNIELLLRVISQLLQLKPVDDEQRQGISAYVAGLQQHVTHCYTEPDPKIFIVRTSEYINAAQKYINDHHQYVQQRLMTQQQVVNDHQRAIQKAKTYGIDMGRVSSRTAGSRNGYYTKEELQRICMMLRPYERHTEGKSVLVQKIWTFLSMS